MTNLLSRLFGRGKKGSGATAKDRLRFVLQHDRINLPPERMEEMKREILAVIVKYLVVDKDRVEIDLEQRDRSHSKLVAEIPVAINTPPRCPIRPINRPPPGPMARTTAQTRKTAPLTPTGTKTPKPTTLRTAMWTRKRKTRQLSSAKMAKRLKTQNHNLLSPHLPRPRPRWPASAWTATPNRANLVSAIRLPL